MAQCPHGYWHASQCPYCLIDSLRGELRRLTAQAAAVQIEHDRAVGELRRRDILARKNGKRGGRPKRKPAPT